MVKRRGRLRALGANGASLQPPAVGINRHFRGNFLFYSFCVVIVLLLINQKRIDDRSSYQSLVIQTAASVDDASGMASAPSAAKKPKAIFHVGPGKTGTSTIQYVFKSHQRFLEEDGFYSVPIAALRLSGAKNEVAVAETLNKTIQQLTFHAANGHHVIISNEHLGNFINGAPLPGMHYEQCWPDLT